MSRKISLRDFGRDLHTRQMESERGLLQDIQALIVESALDRFANQEWYRKTGFKSDVGFQRPTERSRYVECVICHHSGGGRTGTYTDAENGRFSSQWQYDHSKPHLFECVCGVWFHKSQALGAHVSSNRRWRNPGHGRMDRVGSAAQA